MALNKDMEMEDFELATQEIEVAKKEKIEAERRLAEARRTALQQAAEAKMNEYQSTLARIEKAKEETAKKLTDLQAEKISLQTKSLEILASLEEVKERKDRLNHQMWLLEADEKVTQNDIAALEQKYGSVKKVVAKIVESVHAHKAEAHKAAPKAKVAKAAPKAKPVAKKGKKK